MLKLSFILVAVQVPAAVWSLAMQMIPITNIGGRQVMSTDSQGMALTSLISSGFSAFEGMGIFLGIVEIFLSQCFQKIPSEDENNEVKYE